MAINFPNSPSSGDTHTVSGKIWQWDGEKWKAYGASISPGVLKIDAANNRVGINQTTPTVALDVTGGLRVTGDLTIEGTTTTIESTTIAAQTSLTFEGATADDFETTLTLVDPTADRTITLPDSTGTVALAAAVLPLAGGAMTGAITTNSTFDGVDIATRDGVLTSTTTTADAALPKAGGAMTGAITTNSTFDGVDIATRDAILTSTTTTAGAALPKAGGTLTGAVTGTDATFTGTTTPYVDVVSETGASHTFATSDAGKYIHCTGAAGNVTITMPQDSATAFPIGTQMLFSCPHASNKITFAAGSGAAVTSLDDKLTLKGPDGVAAVLKWTTNSWLLFGPLE